MTELLLNLFLGAPPVPPPVPARRELYVKRFLSVAKALARLKFSALQLRGEDRRAHPDEAVVVAANHPGFWDPVVCGLVCQRLFPDHQIFAPIDEQALRTHWYFNSLGFFGIEKDSIRGFRRFQKVGGAIFREVRNPCLVVTPQGDFAEATQRPVRFKRGLAHLLSREVSRPVSVFPLAIAYEQQERLALMTLGPPLRLDSRPISRNTLHRQLEMSLEECMELNTDRQRGGINILERTA